jgi:hypothetical protein
MAMVEDFADAATCAHGDFACALSGTDADVLAGDRCALPTLPAASMGWMVTRSPAPLPTRLADFQGGILSSDDGFGVLELDALRKSIVARVVHRQRMSRDIVRPSTVLRKAFERGNDMNKGYWVGGVPEGP